jgi:holo-[acyl-carrier protein] synthase
MIVGIGTDIVDMGRLREVLARHGEVFTGHVYTEREQREAGGRIEYYAGRWAAKEAAAKALGCGMGATCSFTDIEISNDPHGAPVLNCTAGAALELAKKHHSLRWHVSISHERSCAVAIVIIESI